MRTPLISVIIPTRGRPELLRRAVLSALGQTVQEIEVIVVIDGPDPKTAAELHTIIDDRLRSISMPASVGAAEARNVGARAAKGQWIALLDDDDEWLPKKLFAQLRMAEDSCNRDIVVVCRYVVRREGHPEVLRPRRLRAPGEPVAEFMFDYLCYFQTSTFFCSRELFLRIPFDKTLPAFQDIDWFLRVTTTPGVTLEIVPEPLSFYYSPEDRSSITSKLGWQARVAWGTANRHRMTRRAYSRFISGSCVGRAAEDNAGLSGLVVLLRECVLRGFPTPANVALILGGFLVRADQRRKIRDALFLPSHTRTSLDT